MQKTSMTLLAGALVLSLSACASRPIVDPDSRMGRAGQKIGEVSSDLWVKTKHVFRLDGTDAYHGPDALPPGAVASKEPVEMPTEYKDELDLALVQDEFDTGPGHNDDVILSAVEKQSAELVIGEEAAPIEIVSLSNPAIGQPVEEPVLEQPAAEQGSETELIELVEIAEESPERAVVLADLDYEVQANENLWDISKKLTGDATNWQQLAALNSLDSNGTVYSGQKLEIPGDMLKADAELPALAAATPAMAPAETETDNGRLIVPTATAVETVSEIVVTEAPATAIPAGPATSFQVQAGESMWDLAKRTTGDATNWKSIAAANGMTPAEAALIKYGQSLDIPNDLLKVTGDIAAPAAEDSTIAAEAPVETKTEQATTEIATTEAEAEATVIAENTAGQTEGDELSDESLKIMPAKFQSEPPVIKSAEAEADSAESDSKDWIMVSGTYYPKAIYNDANFSATLLTRVSPGTKLQVSRAIGPWFEVKTDRGMGYVHSRDIK